MKFNHSGLIHQAFRVVLLLAFCCALTATSVAQNQYYVNGTTGSDANDGSQARPWKTLSRANSALVVGSGGAVVNVAPSTYAQGANELVLSKSGTSSAFITYQCTTIRACTITSTLTGNSAMVNVSGSFIKVIGFVVTDINSAIPNANLGYYITGHNVWVTQGTIHGMQPNCGSAGGGAINIATGAGSGDVFDSNLIYDIGWANSACNTANTVHGINLEANGPSTATVTNNIIHHVKGGWCIAHTAAAVGSVGSIISHNLLFSCGNGGIVLDEVGGVIDYNTVTNNTILVNGTSQAKFGIYEYRVSGTHNKYANNNVYGNAGGDYRFQTGSQTGGISVNPALGTTFVNWQADGRETIICSQPASR